MGYIYDLGVSPCKIFTTYKGKTSNFIGKNLSYITSDKS